MPLSWNEIKSRSVHFSKEWETETNEHAEAKSFWDDFFHIFGISRRRVATFEQIVKKQDNSTGYIDLLWKGVILIEHKSRGKDLDKAYQQAKDYFPGIKEKELPRYILVSDFARFRLYDLEENTQHEFTLNELSSNIHLFGFIAGYQKRTFKEEDPVNIEAAELMGLLHDKLKDIGYAGHHLEIYLVRLLFCLFADDTNIFEKNIFWEYIDLKTNEDGSDLASHISTLFYVLNTPEDKRLTNLDESLNAFPYVNGSLFEESIPPASFDSDMRQLLLRCCELDWGKISPAIFGSLFQSVMNPELRRNLGAHYTSEKNILKLIKPLFLDGLWEEFQKVKGNRKKLEQFHDKLASLTFLDPACGCGNFLIITYRELRLLELEILKILFTYDDGDTQHRIHINTIFKLDVDSYYGIEREEFPARIAEVAMWLIDHQMNMKISEEFGLYFSRLPLKKGANIVIGNALRIDWESIVPKEKLSYILGNPPFIGKHLQDEEQSRDTEIIFNGIKGAGVLDYVTCWYIKAAKYIQNTTIKAAFVSTNSISQGEQVGILWNELFNKYNIKIHFAHRTFQWNNEAKGVAGVYVVIIGFANFDSNSKTIFEYNTPKSNAHEIKVKNINPYLIEATDLVILSRTKPVCEVPRMMYGSKPVDNGNLFLNDNEKNELLEKEPNAVKFIKPILSSKEFLNGKNRWVLWLVDINPAELKKMPLVYNRVNNVKLFRLKSKKASVQKQADTPTLFSEIRQPEKNYILIPRHSSENRKYIPMGFFNPNFIVSDSCTSLPNASLYHFGVLSSFMHMTWVNYVCGRLESRFRYSNDIVYNNFPWPENPGEKNIKQVEEKAQTVLDVRNEFSGSSLADLYDPLTMPPKLVKAHNQLDKAVDRCYRSQPFVSDMNRMEFLFELYEKYTNGMFQKEKKPGKKKSKESAVEADQKNIVN